MQPENRPVSYAEDGTTTSEDASYWKRMLLIQRWRRIAWLVCLFLILWAFLAVLLDVDIQYPSTVMLVSSMFAFIVAIVVAVNFLTLRLRNQPRPHTSESAGRRSGSIVRSGVRPPTE